MTTRETHDGCERMVALMLEAELDELRGTGGSALAAHLRRCERCARAAAVLVAETERLAAAVALPRGVPRQTPRGRPSRRAAASVAWPAVGLALAASLAMLAVLREPATTGGAGPAAADPLRARAVMPAVAVTAPVVAKPGAESRATRSGVATSVAAAAGGRPRRSGAEPVASSAAPRFLARAGDALAGRERLDDGAPARLDVAPLVVASVEPTPLLSARAERPADRQADPAPATPADPGGTPRSSLAVTPPPGTRAQVLRTSNPGVTVVWLY